MRFQLPPLQFSLRFLLVLTLVVAGFFAGRASRETELQAERARAEQERAKAQESIASARRAQYMLLVQSTQAAAKQRTKAEVELQRKWLDERIESLAEKERKTANDSSGKEPAEKEPAEKEPAEKEPAGKTP